MAKEPRARDTFSLNEPIGTTPIVEPGNDGNKANLGTDGGSSSEFVDPQAARNASGDGTASDAPKRRGRPPGSKNNAPKAASNQDIGAIEATLLSIHIVLVARIPEMAIEPAEAKMMAEAIARVSRHYPKVAAVMTGKIADHIALFTAVSAVYGTRLVAINERVKNPKPPLNNPNVVTMNPTGQPFRTN